MSNVKTQTSESFRLSALLSFSGGLQDAYTYNVRDGVFANAQTGNVVLMSQNWCSFCKAWYRNDMDRAGYPSCGCFDDGSGDRPLFVLICK